MTKARILADYVAGGTTAAEFDYMDGVTSNVQTQMDAKAPLASPTFTGGMTVDGTTVFNEASADVDFRVEGNGNANLFYVDAGNDRIGIGTSSVDNLLHVEGSATTAKFQTSDRESSILIQNDSQTWKLVVYDYGNDGTDHLGFHDGTADRLVIGNNGKVGIGTTSPGESLHVDGGQIKCSKSSDGTDHSITIHNSYSAGGSTDEKAGINLVVGNGQASIYSYKVSDTESGANRDVGFQIWTQQNNAFSEKFRVDDAGNLTATDTSIGSLSDERLKTNIEDYDYDLATFKALKPRIFDWKNSNEHCGETRRRGFVAQELKLVDDYWVNTHEAKPLVDQILDAETYYEEGDTLPEGKNIGDVKTETTYDYQYKKGDGSDYDLMDDGSDLDKTIITAKLGKKDTMYVSIIQQLITKIETLETKVTALENA